MIGYILLNFILWLLLLPSLWCLCQLQDLTKLN